MITKVKEIYICEHCRKLYQIKRYCEEHEPKCRKNPENHQRCLDGCMFLEKKQTTFHFDTFRGSDYTEVEILFCNAKTEGVYPFWVNGFLEEDILDGETPNNVMPKECLQYKSLV